MSLDKAIAHGKEFRKPYMGSKRYSKSCRNHGGCPYCERNRLFKFRDKHPLDGKMSASDDGAGSFYTFEKEGDSVGLFMSSP